MPDNLESEDILYNLACECEGLFDQLQEAFQKTKSEAATVGLCAEFQQRFAIWAAHLGVFARKSQCLDTRLRNHLDLQDLVARLLDILCRSLQQCTIDTAGQREGHAVPTAALKTIDDTLTRLNRIGVTIRQSGRGQFDTRANKFAAGLDLGSFASLCANAVQALYPNAHQSLKDYLSKSMTDRYARMLFFESRHKKLETRRERRIGLSPIYEVPSKDTQTSNPIIQLAMMTKPPVLANHSRPPPALSQSDLSSVNVYQIRNRLRPPDEASTKFHKTSSIQANQGNYPRLPVTGPGSSIFTCPWCSELLGEKTLSESEWRQHIDRDLKPYTCLYEGCPEAHPAYPTFDEWFKHMELHDWRWHQQVYLTSSWVCTVCEFNPDVYSSPQALYSHLEASHSCDFSSAQLQAISRQSKTEQPRASNDCLLCCFAVQEQGHSDEAVFPKRRKEQPKQDASKSARKTLEMANPDSHTSDLEFSDTSSDSDDMKSHQRRKQRNKERSKVVARHVAVHLQVLMLLTLRLAAALQDDDGDLEDGTKSDSVDIDEGNSASIGTDLGRLSHIASGVDAIMKDGHDESDVDNDESAMDSDDNLNNDIVDEDTPVPDTDLDLNFIPRQYDDLVAKDDKFLNKVIESGAYQSWKDELPELVITPPPPGSDVVQEEADRYHRESIMARKIKESETIASSEDEGSDLEGEATHSSPSSKHVIWGENSTKRFVVEPSESLSGSQSLNELAESEKKPRPRLSKIAQWGKIAAMMAAGTVELNTELDQHTASRSRDLPDDSNEILSRKSSPAESRPVESMVDKWQRHSADEVVVIDTPPDEEVTEDYRTACDNPNADVRIDNEIHPDDIQRIKVTQETTNASTFKSRDPSSEHDRPMLNLVRPTPVPSPVSLEPLKSDQDNNGLGMVADAMNNMIRNHIGKLQSSTFFPALHECRQALVSFQWELRPLFRSQAIDAIDTLHFRALSDIENELKFTLLEQESFLSTKMIKDPNYTNAFCKNILDYTTRLTAVTSEILEEQEAEPFSQSDIEAVPLETLQVSDQHYRNGVRILVRSLPGLPDLRLNSGNSDKWLALRADGASPNSPKHKVLSITQDLIDAKCTIRMLGSIGDDLLRPPLWCELYYHDPARDSIAFSNKSYVPVSLSRMSHASSSLSLNEHYIVKPGLSQSLRPGAFRLEMEDVALLDFRILGKRPTATKPVASGRKLSSGDENLEETVEIEEDFGSRLHRVGHVDFDKIAWVNDEVKKRRPQLSPFEFSTPIMYQPVMHDPVYRPLAPVYGIERNRDAPPVGVRSGHQTQDGEAKEEDMEVPRPRHERRRPATVTAQSSRQMLDEDEDEEEAQRQRLRQRMSDRSRFAAGSNTRYPRAFNDNGVYRWEWE
ncbi:hypothetical protein V8C34DRAFT_281798 [Trichoderma compactum]